MTKEARAFSADKVLTLPVGFGRVPVLYPEADLNALVGHEVVFLSRQSGRVRGAVTRIGAFGAHSRALFVRLACADLIRGDSGRPLYFDDGGTVFLVGRLVGGGALAGEPGFSEGIYLHPWEALTALGISESELFG
jgi:hypothetical protein